MPDSLLVQYPKQKFDLLNPVTKQTETKTAKQLEGQQMPEGFILKQTVNGAEGDRGRVGEGYDPSFKSYTRVIKYGPTPLQNDTSYRVTGNNLAGLGITDAEIGFNQGYYKNNSVLKFGGNINYLNYCK